MEKTRLCGLTPEEILGLTTPGHYNYSHAVTVANAIYKKKISGFAEMKGLPGKFVKELDAVAATGIFSPETHEISSDKTIKFLFVNSQGLQYETVYLPGEKRVTVCVSTQSGCRMGCHFCVTGRFGFHGNLSAGDIVNQVISLPDSEKVNHVVFMGMGEPLDNIENVILACRILTAEWGLSLSPRNITVSTVGITHGVTQFLNRSDCNLTLSLHSPFPEERMVIIPAEKRYPANEILTVMKEFPLRKKRRLSVAYVMIKGVNDTERHLEGLKDLIRPTSIRINLLPYHPSAGDCYLPSSAERMQYFRHGLITAGISASIRESRGADISAACGLLASGLR